MDDLNSAIDRIAQSPAGALLVFLAVFLARVYLDRLHRRTRAKKGPKTKDKQHT